MNFITEPALLKTKTFDYIPPPSMTSSPSPSRSVSGRPSIKRPTSTLPYHIARQRKLADRMFVFARSKEHGLKHLDIRRGVLALFWLVATLIVASILASMIADLVRTYASMPVATQIRAERDLLTFPDVTVCQKVPFYIDDDGGDKNGTEESQGGGGGGGNDGNKSREGNDDDAFLTKLQKYVKTRLSQASLKVDKEAINSALLIQMAMRKNQAYLRAFQHIIYCKYNNKECSFYNFTEIGHLRYVQCFTFSPGERVPTGGHGLQFVFYKNRTNRRPFVMLNDLEDPAFDDSINDGINVFVHSQRTFPTYSISNMPTSFSLRYGQQASITVSGLMYRSDLSGRKSCITEKKPYKYINFRDGANFLEYKYTYEDCVANMKQRFIREACRCFSDDLFVPFEGLDAQHKTVGGNKDQTSSSSPSLNDSTTEFCRDVRGKTSQRLREAFLCFDRYEEMPTTTVLDQFISMDVLHKTRDNLDRRKIERLSICSLLCEKNIYSTRFFEVIDIDPNTTLPLSILSSYVNQLDRSNLNYPELKNLWLKAANRSTTPSNQDEGDGDKSNPDGINVSDVVVVNIRTSTELMDAWEEELTETLSSLISNLGGTMGLCAGISFLSFFFLVFFFGRAFLHWIVSFLLWFWWAIYLGRPPATPVKQLERESGWMPSWKSFVKPSPSVPEAPKPTPQALIRLHSIRQASPPRSTQVEKSGEEPMFILPQTKPSNLSDKEESLPASRKSSEVKSRTPAQSSTNDSEILPTSLVGKFQSKLWDPSASSATERDPNTSTLPSPPTTGPQSTPSIEGQMPDDIVSVSKSTESNGRQSPKLSPTSNTTTPLSIDPITPSSRIPPDQPDQPSPKNLEKDRVGQASDGVASDELSASSLSTSSSSFLRHSPALPLAPLSRPDAGSDNMSLGIDDEASALNSLIEQREAAQYLAKHYYDDNTRRYQW